MAKTLTSLTVKIQRKYWPMSAKSDNDALEIGTVLALPYDEAKRLIDCGGGVLVTPDKVQDEPEV
jgi:hypothetical protein